MLGWESIAMKTLRRPKKLVRRNAGRDFHERVQLQRVAVLHALTRANANFECVTTDIRRKLQQFLKVRTKFRVLPEQNSVEDSRSSEYIELRKVG
jgi:hypothetical protein